MRNKLAQDLIKANSRLLKAVDLMSDKELVDKWSKKEILAHITGWYEEGVDATPKILGGEKPNSFRLSVNSYNKRSVEKRKNKSTENIIEEMKNLHKKWIEQVKKLNEDQITSFYGTKLGKKQINLLWMINEAISHDNAHANELEMKFKKH